MDGFAALFKIDVVGTCFAVYIDYLTGNLFLSVCISLDLK